MASKARPEPYRSPQGLFLFKHNRRRFTSICLSPSMLSIFIVIAFVTLFFLLHTRFSLQTPPLSSSTCPSLPCRVMHQWQSSIFNATYSPTNYTNKLNSVVHKLRHSVTFLPLKDLRYSHAALEGHTWFMSSMYDTHEDGEVQYQQFPSESSKGRVLCLKGRDTHDGSWNSYALAWPEALPYNTNFMKAMVPFVAWHRMNNCSLPSRWVLYHWGELRFKMGLWVGTLMEATFNGPPNIESFDGVYEDGPVCFEKAVVMRHSEGGMSRERRMEVYDLMRCEARMYCNVSLKGRGIEPNDRGLPVIGMTLFLRKGPRSFKNDTIVAEIFNKECANVEGCRFMVAHSNNLSFCEQVKLMSVTDILISPHGAQSTNMFLMERNTSVMEFFPKGWLKLAGVGQYVYRWIASWSGMKHKGSWRDPCGDDCPYPEDDRRCTSIYKICRIGYNETHFAEWARNVLAEVRTRKIQQAPMKSTAPTPIDCACS